MRKIVIGLASTVSALVLLFSYHTSTNSTAAKDTTTDTGGGTGSSGGTTPNAGSSGSSADGTYTGDAAATRYGDVQVQITVSGGKITAADAIQYPNSDRHDQQINAYAIPILNSEAVDAQSASIDAVSGATVTSDGYITSLQSAIDAAHLQ
ncbi:FMN-binding protein [Propionicimonas paludicola]|uniref:FMN-binding protein n=1 Tax=Propionicimonas paludicola TaxID=185243 RepID=A0A2A9CU90_9ACTN|nr:FMN-binding protein [Propionicimonas paludicola]PFG18013.1 FMN-binding protein [Propionicimonas paludicola]